MNINAPTLQHLGESAPDSARVLITPLYGRRVKANTALGPVNARTFTSVRVDQKLHGRHLGHGSGFLLSLDNDPADVAYLITCYHVLTAREPLNPELLMEGYPDSPDELEFRMFRKDSDTTPTYSTSGTVTTDRFVEHPRRPDGIDLVALPIKFGPKHKLFAIDIDEVENAMPGIAGDDAFVAGFPFNELTDKIAPVWKRASVATEPTLESHGAGRYLIDSASTAGMSGAPIFTPRDVDEAVVEYLDGVKTDPPGPGATGAESAAWLKNIRQLGTRRVRYFDFAGVYVGRTLEPKIPLTLGIGLTPLSVFEMIAASKMVDHPHPPFDDGA